jgi:hypothetical protein
MHEDGMMRCPICGWATAEADTAGSLGSMAAGLELSSDEREVMMASLLVNWRARGCGLLHWKPDEGIRAISKPGECAHTMGSTDFHINPVLVQEHVRSMNNLLARGQINEMGKPIGKN